MIARRTGRRRMAVRVIAMRMGVAAMGIVSVIVMAVRVMHRKTLGKMIKQGLTLHLAGFGIGVEKCPHTAI